MNSFHVPLRPGKKLNETSGIAMPDVSYVLRQLLERRQLARMSIRAVIDRSPCVCLGIRRTGWGNFEEKEAFDYYEESAKMSNQQKFFNWSDCLQILHCSTISGRLRYSEYYCFSTPWLL